ncbi:hypothetical protein GCM10007939_09350 [Amylibacter marinus]|uniref:EF-hand domain-containing protein n=1 Tax=Amylibacter marinus TaxID=1475483 RepID=A0ABQ5VU00_9RHOB|nr:EF-hand domain-containing protein [Amylibacter marinus]GLQ34652.1 hypothetical protein GCM10007939_09350 [Amylibacter marinus]
MNKLTKTTVLATTIIAAMGAFAAAHADEDRKGHGKKRGFNFETLDSNSDGFVTPEEMEANQLARFNAQDTDGDGFLTKEEITAAFEARAEERKREMKEGRLDKMIEKMDANEDGKLSSDEMKHPNSNKMFEKLDTNGDGKISKEEAEAAKGKKKGKAKGKGKKIEE